MTQEEKAKAYDKALEKIKYAMEHSVSPIFPELADSEDERVRKALMRFHKSTIDIDGIKGDDIIAWLEKQGEKKTKWSEDDEGMLNNCIGAIHIAGKQVCNSYTAKDKKRMTNWLESIKRRMEGEK